MTKEAAIADYVIEAGMSRFTVRGFAGGLLSGLGHNPVVAIPDFAGDVRWDPADPQKASLHLRIRAASLAVQNDMSDKDRREMERIMREEIVETYQLIRPYIRRTPVLEADPAERLPDQAGVSRGRGAQAEGRVEVYV